MKIGKLKYIAAYSIPLVTFFSLYQGGWYTYVAIAYAFGLLPFLELFTRGTKENMDEIEEELAKENRRYDLILYGLVPFHIFILCYFLFRISAEGLFLYEKLGMVIAYGLAGGLAINYAHELGHRNTKYEQTLSKTLLLTTLYMHFFIEHNRGHHKNVATEHDPASSRYGEHIYAFFIRTITGSWLSAWNLEAQRLEKNKLPFWSIHNEMLRFQVLQILLVGTIAFLFGVQVMLLFIGGAIISFMLLETVNYIEHYGLQRKLQGDRYERTLPVHSWNSNHPIGRLVMLELSRHSDHHFMANRKYQVLRHFDESPQLPTGYPGMMLLALVPPLWFNVMHKRIAKYKQSIQGKHLA